MKQLLPLVCHWRHDMRNSVVFFRVLILLFVSFSVSWPFSITYTHSLSLFGVYFQGAKTMFVAPIIGPMPLRARRPGCVFIYVYVIKKKHIYIYVYIISLPYRIAFIFIREHTSVSLPASERNNFLSDVSFSGTIAAARRVSYCSVETRCLYFYTRVSSAKWNSEKTIMHVPRKKGKEGTRKKKLPNGCQREKSKRQESETETKNAPCNTYTLSSYSGNIRKIFHRVLCTVHVRST